MNRNGKLTISPSEGTHSTVRVGAKGREDPDTEIHIVRKNVDNGQWERIDRVFVNGKKAFKFDLHPGDYHVMVVGDKIAGVVTTAGHNLPVPFNIFMDPPEDHGKDFMRLDLPAGKPVPPTLERAIKAALKE